MSLHFSAFKSSPVLLERLWDLWCIVSVIGIWPRFIEPQLLLSSHHVLPIPGLPKELQGISIVQISDLHYGPQISKNFLDRIVKKVWAEKPDILVFTGDLLSYSDLYDIEGLETFLSKLSAPLGAFAILGNHDYVDYVSIGDDGTYKITDHTSPLLRGFGRLLGLRRKSEDTRVVHPIMEQPELRRLFARTGFQLLNNQTVQIGKGFAKLNITGLGDLIAGHCNPSQAFSHSDPRAPTIVLTHNPDSYPLIRSYPGDLILAGHTHGGQVNLPFLWSKVTPLKNKQFKSGLIKIDNRYLYVNRGLAATFQFRWFAPPEITKFTLVQGGSVKEPLYQTQPAISYK